MSNTDDARRELANGEYRWISRDDLYEIEMDESYELLLRPDGTEVTIITEPEDRRGSRDLKPIVIELDTLAQRVTELEKALDNAVKQRDHFGCPQCDGSGGYYDSYGEPVQCQACGEYDQIRKLICGDKIRVEEG